VFSFLESPKVRQSRHMRSEGNKDKKTISDLSFIYTRKKFKGQFQLGDRRFGLCLNFGGYVPRKHFAKAAQHFINVCIIF
jgi:hypothetical protein